MITIQNKYYKLCIDETNGRIQSLSDQKENLISDIQPPLLSLCFRTEAGEEQRVDVTMAEKCVVEKKENGYVITYSEFPFLTMRNTVYVLYDDSPYIKWHAEIDCEMQLEWMELPGICVPDTFQDSGGNSKILWPFNEGTLITDIKAREKSGIPYREPQYPSQGDYSMCPGMISTPFITSWNDDGGIYYGVHDTNKNTFHVDFYREQSGVRLLIRSYPGIEGGHYCNDFDIVLGVFHGDWYDAAEIYRCWFEENHNADYKKIKDNEQLPQWYGESPVILGYCVRGHHDTDVMEPNQLFPYINGMKVVDELSEKLQSKIMVLLMHWEGSAPWAPPYVWPPYGGEECLKEYIDALHQKGHLIGVYCSGFGWTQTSNVMDYHMEDVFEKNHLAEVMCVSPTGELPLSKICNGQRFGYDLCPSQEFCKTTLTNEVKHMSDAGIDYVQLLDQNHGGTAYMCYSKKHGHPPVPGRWQNEAVLDIMKTIKGEISNKEMLFGCESAAAEVFIPELSFSDNRFELNYMMGEAVPLYSYLYHPYINNFMGNQILAEGTMDPMNNRDSLNYRLAYSFVAGDFLTLIINDEGKIQWDWGQRYFDESFMPDGDTAITLVKNMNAFRMGYAKKYLYTGKMVRPLPIEAEKTVTMYTPAGDRCVEPLLTARYQADSGEYGQIIVNYTKEDVECTVCELKGAKLYDGETWSVAQDDRMIVKALTTVLVETNHYAEIKKNTVEATNQLKESEYVSFENPNGKGIRVMFVGNSITRHGVMPEIGWYGDYGMAASSKEKDYVHRLIQKINSVKEDAAYCICQVASWERGYKDGTEKLYHLYENARAFQADIIVLRFIENCPMEGFDADLFKSELEKLLLYINPTGRAKFVSSTGFWRHCGDEAIRSFATEQGIPLAELGDLGEKDEMKAVGLFEHGGVANHPGDLGMARIAERIYEKLQPYLTDEEDEAFRTEKLQLGLK